MTKKEMIEILVQEEGFSESELNEMLKSEVQEIFDISHSEEDEDSSKLEKESTREIDLKLEDKTVESEVVKLEQPEAEEEEVDTSKLSKRELRTYQRTGKL